MGQSTVSATVMKKEDPKQQQVSISAESLAMMDKMIAVKKEPGCFLKLELDGRIAGSSAGLAAALAKSSHNCI